MNSIERKDRGLAYKCDSSIIKQQLPVRMLVHFYNKTLPFNVPRFRLLLKAMGIKSKGQIDILPPFHCEYGKNIEVGERFFANCGCVMLDAGKIRIGNNVLLAPNVGLYTSGHPMHHIPRTAGYEYCADITIGDNVWIGGNTVVCPGVSIGKNTVIGAASVVTKDIPEGVFAAGNPCKVIREITDEEKYYLHKNQRLDEDTLESLGF